MAIHGTPTLAYVELQSIRKLAAFSIQGATLRKLNQHAREYTFADASVLRIYRSGRAQSFIRKGGLCDCVSLLRVNAFGNGGKA